MQLIQKKNNTITDNNDKKASTMCLIKYEKNVYLMFICFIVVCFCCI